MLKLLLLCIQLVLLLLLQVSECMVVLQLQAGKSGCMLLLSRSQLSLQPLCLSLTVTHLMPTQYTTVMLTG